MPGWHRLPQSTLKTGFHTVPVYLEGCLRSKIVPGVQLVLKTVTRSWMIWRTIILHCSLCRKQWERWCPPRPGWCEGFLWARMGIRDANAMDTHWVSMDTQIVPVHPLSASNIQYWLVEISKLSREPCTSNEHPWLSSAPVQPWRVSRKAPKKIAKVSPCFMP